MAKSNHTRVGDGLELLNDGLRPFVEREMKAHYSKEWTGIVQGVLGNKTRGSGDIHWDTQALLTVMWDQWNTVFRNTLGPAERSLVSELRDVRNRWAHQDTFNSDDAYRSLDSVERAAAGGLGWRSSGKGERNQARVDAHTLRPAAA